MTLHKFNSIFRYLPLLLLAVCLVGCGGERRSYDYAAYTELDSAIGAIKSLDTLQQAQQEYNRQHNKLAETMAWRYMGRAYRDKGDFTASLNSLHKALAMATEMTDTFEMTNAFNGLGTTYRRLGLLDYASENHYKALTLTMLHSEKKVFRAKKNRVISLNGLGNVYLSLHNDHLADSVLRLALQGEQELNSPLGQAINYANLGSIFENNDKNDSAWAYYRLSMEKNREANSTVGMALCLEHFGHLYEQDNNYDEAIKQYAESYKLMSKTGDEWHKLNSCLSLARIGLAKNDIPTFRRYIDEAVETAKRINSAEHLQTAYGLLYTYYDIIKDDHLALYYYRNADLLQDSMVNVKKLTDIENMRVSLIQSRTQAEVNLAQQDMKTERTAKNWALAIIVVILFLVGTSFSLLYKLWRSRNQQQQIQHQMQVVRETFFTNVTHELRTPLMIIGGLAKHIQDAKDPLDTEEVHHQAAVIYRQSNNLLELVNQLLSITRVKSAIGPSEWRNGNLVPFMRMVVDSYDDYAHEKQIHLSFSAQESEIVADIVPSYIKKIVRNLVGNALKFTPTGGYIKVMLLHQDNNYQIRVADNGQGMTPEVVSHIFEPFYHGATDSHNTSSGIGLVLVHQIVESLHGSISVETAPGKGSTFTVTLPLLQGKTLPALEDDSFVPEALPASLTEPENQKKAPLPETTNLQRPTLLIVEDTPDAAYYIATQLRDQYNLLFASDGAEAIDTLATNIPDLIVTDLMMPRMDGYEFIRHVRADDQLAHLPIIMLTARVTDAARIEGFEAGADAYLLKPFSGQELRLRIEKLLEQRKRLRERFSTIISETTEKSLQAATAQPAEADTTETHAEENLENAAPETIVSIETKEIGQAESKPQTQELSTANREFLTKVNDKIYVLMKRRQVDVETLAMEMCISRSQFNRRLALLTGMNASGYITEVRMSLARRLLQSEVTMPISDVAFKCGYEDMGYFARIFKQTTGCTPTQYRRKLV